MKEKAIEIPDETPRVVARERASASPSKGVGIAEVNGKAEANALSSKSSWQTSTRARSAPSGPELCWGI